MKNVFFAVGRGIRRTVKAAFEAKEGRMQPWFQAIVAFGIIAVSVGSLSYTWRTVSTYRLEQKAKAICNTIYDGDETALDSTDAAGLWLNRRRCVNDALGSSSFDTNAPP